MEDIVKLLIFHANYFMGLDSPFSTLNLLADRNVASQFESGWLIQDRMLLWEQIIEDLS